MDTKKKLTQQELLEVSCNISKYHAPNCMLNEERLVILPIDLQSIYVYWSLPEDKSALSTDALLPNEKLMLRINSVSTKELNENPIIEMAINERQSKKEIKLSVIQKEALYVASIGQGTSKEGFISLIKSTNTQSLLKETEHNDSHLVNNRARQPKFLAGFLSKNQSNKNHLDLSTTNRSGVGIIQ